MHKYFSTGSQKNRSVLSHKFGAVQKQPILGSKRQYKFLLLAEHFHTNNL